MNQFLIDKIKQLVNQDGLINAINLLGGNKDIIRKVYTDNPESYLDYLIGNLYPMKDSYGLTRWVYEYKVNILHYEDSTDTILIDDFIWNYFYKSVMQFDDRTIESIFTKWLCKYYPELSERKPMVYSDLWDLKRKWTNSGLLDDIDGLSNINQQPLRRGPDYMVVSKSIAEFYKSINVGE